MSKLETRFWLCGYVVAAVALSGCTPDSTAPTMVQYAASDYGMVLQYPARLYLHEKRGDVAPELALALVEDTRAHRDLLAGHPGGPTEAPPMITVDVYANPDGQAAAAWVEANTNWLLVDKEPERLRFGDRDYLVYRWDGLYAGKSAVHAGARYVYVFSVSWITEQDPLLAEFAALLDGVRISGRPAA